MQKEFTNDLCREKGLSVTEKGKHFDGTAMKNGELSAWNKDKYNLLKNDQKKSFVIDCGLAVMDAVQASTSREEFISGMEASGWRTTWNQRKHITFENDKGEKVRDSNLSKTFNLKISKEDLLNEFTRQAALRLAAAGAAEKRKDDEQRAEKQAEKAKGDYEEKKGYLTAFAVFGIAYSCVATIFTATHSPRVIADIQAFLLFLWDGLGQLFEYAEMVWSAAWSLQEQIPFQVLNTVVPGLLAALGFLGLFSGVLALIAILQYVAGKFYHKTFADHTSLAVALVTAAALIWFGDDLSIPINLVVVFALIHGGYLLIRYIRLKLFGKFET